MSEFKNILIPILENPIKFNKKVRCEKDLEMFIIHFLKFHAPNREATAQNILKNLEESGLLNNGFKLSPRRIGRGVLSDRSWFKGTKKYDSISKQDLTFWRYDP